jgi:NAD(P)-dependent dehydrogenase (short-subunit alcohol dehydrogenase family)
MEPVPVRRAIPDVTDVRLRDLVSLDGRRAVVTGAARGIGRAIADRLAEAGASVIIADRDHAAAITCAGNLADRHHGTVLGMPIDVRDPASVTELTKAAEERLGGIDIWVNNAGIYPPRAIADMTVADWDDTMAVNLRGSFLGAQAAMRCMQPGGASINPVILFIVSVSGLRGRAGLAHYCASKHGVAGLVKSMALEVAQQGIRVLGIAPTLVTTPGILESRATGQGSGHEALEVFLTDAALRMPLGRVSVPDDIARVALFCVSDLALYMTGCIIPVDGGITA